MLFENEHVQSNFSEQSEQDDQTPFIIAESSDSDDISVICTVQTINQVSTIPIPSLKMSILPSKFHKPVPIIGFIDTSADMIDPSVLPLDSWENHSKLFKAVNGETFETTLITKLPIGIQFFPNCIIWKKIVASTLPDKDLLIGFDILHLVKNLFITNSCSCLIQKCSICIHFLMSQLHTVTFHKNFLSFVQTIILNFNILPLSGK